jgi:LuxR family transcriptional regulator, activator of tox operons
MSSNRWLGNVRHDGLDGLTESVLALGEDNFDHKLFRFLCGCLTADMYSAFAVTGGSEVNYLFAGTVSGKGDFPAIASQQYARRFWKSDPLMRSLLSGPAGYQPPQTQRWDEIPRGEYRAFCYERPGVVDRLSLYCKSGQTAVLVNLYRYGASGYFSDDEVGQIARYAGVVPALIIKNFDLTTANEELKLHPPIESLIYLMESWKRGLSRREIEVCAAMLVGMPLKDIGRKLGLGVSTVVTYKKRAFGKIGVATRRDLQEFYRRESGTRH